MRKALSVILLCLMPLVSDAKGPPFGKVPDEPYLREVQDLEIPKLEELHKMGRIDASIQLARELWWAGDAETPINLLSNPAEQGIPVAQYLLAAPRELRRP